MKTRFPESEEEAKEQTNYEAWNQALSLTAPLLLLTPTIQFSWHHKRPSHKWKQHFASDSVGLIFTPSVWFSLVLLVYTSDWKSDCNSIANENQPLTKNIGRNLPLTWTSHFFKQISISLCGSKNWDCTVHIDFYYNEQYETLTGSKILYKKFNHPFFPKWKGGKWSFKNHCSHKMFRRNSWFLSNFMGLAVLLF